MTQAVKPLWHPSRERVESARITHFTRWLEDYSGERFPDYESVWRWSTDDVGRFWSAAWRYFQLPEAQAGEPAYAGEAMPGIEWFPGRSLNFTAQVFRNRALATPAILHDGESSGAGEVSWSQLEAQVAACARLLEELGVRRGDRVVAYLPNVPETVVAFLATASLGAIWSVCSPDTGVESVLPRFGQLDPVVLICADGYRYAGRSLSRTAEDEKLAAGLPSLRRVVWVRLLGLEAAPKIIAGVGVTLWAGADTGSSALSCNAVPFSHPLWIVFSSGTTGLPKAIVHGHGGIVLNGLIQSGLHSDLSAGDRAFWLCSTNWIVWNALVCGLLLGVTVCLHDGSVTGPGPTPDWSVLWRFALRNRVSYFGAGAAFYLNCLRAGLRPRDLGDMSMLCSLASTGSPLSPEGFEWAVKNIGGHVWVTSVCGGTDIAGSFLMGVPTLPVYPGELQCRALGAAVRVYGPDGRPIVDDVGELVCERPLPSMPLRFWNDPDNQRYIASYFSEFADDVGRPLWRHGDWLKLIPRPGATGGVVFGRSDATVNRHGIRIGTAEYYRVIEAVPGIADSLVIDLEYLGRPSHLAVFVVLDAGRMLTPSLVDEIRSALRTVLSPRHLPDEITQVSAVPRTRTGKKLEVPIRKLLLGLRTDDVLQRDALANPESLQFFIDLARARAPNPPQ